MTRLAPCPACNRHVRVDETQCPFCAVALGGALRARPAVATAGLKRAALFALGATLTTAACGDDDDSGSDDTQQEQPVYGAPIPPEPGGTGGQGGGAGDSGSSGGSVGTAGGMNGGGELPLPQPVYGAPIGPDPDGTAGGGSPGEMNEMDAGIPVIPEPIPSVQPLYGAVPAPQQDE